MKKTSIFPSSMVVTDNRWEITIFLFFCFFSCLKITNIVQKNLQPFYTLSPQHCTDNIFECYFEQINCISNHLSLKFIPNSLNDNKSELVLVMACCHQTTRHYLDQWWHSSLSHLASACLNELKHLWWKCADNGCCLEIRPISITAENQGTQMSHKIQSITIDARGFLELFQNHNKQVLRISQTMFQNHNKQVLRISQRIM